MTTIAIANLEEFAELPPAARANCAKLPPLAFGFIGCHEPGKRIIAVRRGEQGYFATKLDRPSLSVENAKATVALMNQRLGVTVEQKSALLCGSLFGFDTPGADPDNYRGEVPLTAKERASRLQAVAGRASP
jgi:hypothetical protein